MADNARWYAVRVIDNSTSLIRYHELLKLALQQYHQYDSGNLQETVQMLLEAYMTLAEPAISDLKESLDQLDKFSLNQVKSGN